MLKETKSGQLYVAPSLVRLTFKNMISSKWISFLSIRFFSNLISLNVGPTIKLSKRYVLTYLLHLMVEPTLMKVKFQHILSIRRLIFFTAQISYSLAPLQSFPPPHMELMRETPQSFRWDLGVLQSNRQKEFKSQG